MDKGPFEEIGKFEDADWPCKIFIWNEEWIFAYKAWYFLLLLRNFTFENIDSILFRYQDHCFWEIEILSPKKENVSR